MSLLSVRRTWLSPGRHHQFSSTAAARADFTHAVIGGGVVGLAIARQLSRRPDTTTLLVERHGAVGTETSSRNSEVVHAGIYYGARSLKARLCVRGRQLLYGLCERHGVGHARVGKWIVAQTEAQREAIARIHALCRDELGVPTRWVERAEVARRGEGVRAEAGALESPETGIVDAHGLMVCLQGLFEEAGGVVALNSAVEGVTPLGSSPPGSAGWQLHVRDASTGRLSTVTAETLINAAGLGAVAVHNMIAPPPRHRTLYFAKGTYFSYTSSPRLRVSRLIYPAPEPGAAGLGTHLTRDLAGCVRFGPDVEWVDRPDDLAASADRLAQAAGEIRKYLPAVDEACLSPDYAGVRPKLSYRGAGVSGRGFNDFVITKEEGYEGWVNLLGIESPGLTSCLAIAERVEQLLHASVSG
ncbi:FAD dependent oxidoreductase [Hirsutella rhossiliensis]|uniref:L-2-hydroxyglutarate dehydrogenase, mitochondrial n=1 Tax=Hirsutella rhossiliensis TaxID=111463 RepID=A0A9P8N2I9_9HYPO|nr:FAD dependent oxidoreductase domain-containing protein [Hirsutella rhossiliensis]KAH0965680.1 FAD dependent oxidoreductase domain-containing protein [Hirsutella rhossiliensis]